MKTMAAAVVALLKKVDELELSVSTARDPARTTTPISVCRVAERFTWR